MQSAINNIDKYLELSPQAEDKDEIEELRVSCEEFLTENKTETTVN